MWRSPRDVRGSVWRSSPGKWCYEVRIGDDVYLQDNTGNWEAVYRSCVRSVYALQRILIAGHELLRTWDEIYDATSDDL